MSEPSTSELAERAAAGYIGAMRPSAAAPRPPWFDLTPAEPLARDLAEGVTPDAFARQRAPIRTGTALLARDAVHGIAGRLEIPDFTAFVLLGNVLGTGKQELRKWAGSGIQAPWRRSQLCDTVEGIEQRARWLRGKFARAFRARG